MMLLVRCTLAVMALRMGGLADAQEPKNPNVLFVAVRAPRILPVTTLYRQLHMCRTPPRGTLTR